MGMQTKQRKIICQKNTSDRSGKDNDDKSN